MDNLKQHSGYFIMKSGQTEIAYWSLLQWKVDKLILQSGIFYIKIWIIWNCTVVISLWKMNNPNFHIGFSHNENWTNWYCTVGYFTKKGIILNCTVAIYFIMKSKKSEITQSEKKKSEFKKKSKL